MKQTWIDQLRDQPAVAAALAVFGVGLATLCGAWFFEYVLKYQPCPLCLEERIPYHVVIPLSLLVAIAAGVGAPRKLVMVGFVAILAAVLFNVVLSTYHAGIEWRWWAGPSDCTGPVTDFKSGGGMLSQLQTIHVPRCDEAAFRFLGISLAGYNALISLALVVCAGYGLFVSSLASEPGKAAL